MKETILVTGGAGFIGSHTGVELLEAGYDVIVIDNLSNSSQESLARVQKITQKELKFHQVDIRDEKGLQAIFDQYSIAAVIHFAGLKAVGESCEMPGEYYHNNVYGTLVLTEVMARNGVKKLVFSSSATVYGTPETVPITENFSLSATNPYGRSKLIIEEILGDLSAADQLKKNVDNPWKIVLLRYFNPIGAHISGLIGEDPQGIPNNLMPYVTQVAIGKLKQLSVFGNDYPTKDGTGVRDYIHVVDLALGHIKALGVFGHDKFNQGGCCAYNLGTGIGYSVLDIINAFERVNGQSIRYQFSPRRSGDVAECYANPQLALDELGWEAAKTLDDMVQDVWRWQQNNPTGFA